MGEGSSFARKASTGKVVRGTRALWKKGMMCQAFDEGCFGIESVYFTRKGFDSFNDVDGLKFH